MKKHAEKTVAAVLTLAGIMLASSPSFGQVQVSVGYADTVHLGSVLPSPWRGSPNVVFLGSAGPNYDSGAIKLTNVSRVPHKILKVSVTIGTVIGINLWGNNLGVTIPPMGSLILAGFTIADFDTSDIPPTTTPCTTNGLVPVVHVTNSGGGTTNFLDRGQVLNTGGMDPPLAFPVLVPPKGINGWR